MANLPKTMQAIRIEKQGGIEELQKRDDAERLSQEFSTSFAAADLRDSAHNSRQRDLDQDRMDRVRLALLRVALHELTFDTQSQLH